MQKKKKKNSLPEERVALETCGSNTVTAASASSGRIAAVSKSGAAEEGSECAPSPESKIVPLSQMNTIRALCVRISGFNSSFSSRKKKSKTF